MPMSARRPSTMNSFSPAEVPQNSMAAQQRLQISELQIDKFPHTSIIFVLEDKIQNPNKFLFRFSSDAMSDQFKPYKNCTTWKFIKRYQCPIIKKLKTMVKRSVDQKLGLRNIDARSERIETGAVVKNREGFRWR